MRLTSTGKTEGAELELDRYQIEIEIETTKKKKIAEDMKGGRLEPLTRMKRSGVSANRALADFEVEVGCSRSSPALCRAAPKTCARVVFSLSYLQSRKR
jgi:hypothetical protein